MKKFSKVKYFGAVAAALLAVAPIAAPVVSQVASPVTVQAAAAQPNGNGNAQYATDLDNVFSDTVNDSTATNTSTPATFFAAVNQDVTSGNANNANTLSKLFIKSGNATALGDNTVRFESADFDLTDNGAIQREFQQNSRTAYNFTILLKNTKGQTLATKKVVLNVVRNSKAAFKGATFNVGDSIKSLDSITNAASALTFTNRDGGTTSLKASDVRELGYSSFTTVAGGTFLGAYKQSAADAVFNSGDKVSDNGTTFSRPGEFSQIIKITSGHFESGQSLSSVSKYDLQANDPTNVFVDGSGNVFIRRTIQVTSGQNDKAYYPVFKFTTGAPSSVSDTKTTVYYDGDTLSDAGATFYAGVYGNHADSASYDNIATYLLGLSDINGNSDNPASGKYEGFESSIKNGGLTTALGNTARYTIAGAAITDKNAVESALAKLIPNIYKNQTVNVPLTVSNTRGLKSTVYIPVTIGSNVGTPIATLFTGYTEVTKGSTFNPLDGIQFANSSTDAGIIPTGRIQVNNPVDTSTPGTYTVTYTVTNSAGNTATFTRTVKVVADNKTVFQTVDSVIYVQTSKAPQYKYDSKTDSFTKDDGVAALPLSSGWKTSKKATAADGTVYYIVGGNGYLKASDVTTAKVQKTAGVVTVVDGAGVYTTANTTKDSGNIQYLGANTPWKYFAIATNPDGSRAYLVADNQWVSASSVVERVNSASGTFKVGSDAAPVFNGAGNVLKGQSLKAGSSWKVTGVKNINGKPYYRVSTDGYVRADYGSYKA